MEISRTVNKSMENLNLMNNHQKSIGRVILASTTTPANRLEEEKNLLTFDGILIGFKLVDATIKASEKEKVIAFAGGTHITEAYDLLQKIDNWEPVSHSEKKTIKASIARGIGANVVESKGKPQPISLELIDHYLNR